MRISTRVGRHTYVSMGCLGWLVCAVLFFGLLGWMFSGFHG